MGKDAIWPFTVHSEGYIDFLTTSNTKTGMVGQRITRNKGKGNNYSFFLSDHQYFRNYPSKDMIPMVVISQILLFELNSWRADLSASLADSAMYRF